MPGAADEVISGGASFIPMVQAADFPECDHVTLGDALQAPGRWRQSCRGVGEQHPKQSISVAELGTPHGASDTAIDAVRRRMAHGSCWID
jgi:hypothetical protein